MAITKGAKKAHRSSLRKQVFNLRRTRAMREAVKGLRGKVANGQATEAKADLTKVYKVIDKAAKRGVIKANTAARKKSRLSKLVNKAGK